MAEELAITLLPEQLDGPVWRQRIMRKGFMPGWDGIDTEYFSTRVDGLVVDLAAVTDEWAVEGIADAAWWSTARMREQAGSALFSPRALPDVLDGLVADGSGPRRPAEDGGLVTPTSSHDGSLATGDAPGRSPGWRAGGEREHRSPGTAHPVLTPGASSRRRVRASSRPPRAYQPAATARASPSSTTEPPADNSSAPVRSSPAGTPVGS